MIDVSLPYGNRRITASVPAHHLMGVFAPPRPVIREAHDVLVAAAMTSPIGSKRLREIARKGMKVAIIADDTTRPTPVADILPHVVKELNVAGVPDADIMLMFALGTHDPMTRDEMVRRAGAEMSRRLRMMNSEFRDAAMLKDCGSAPDGTPVIVDRRVVEADLRVAVGAIMPHPECGWGGGGKMLYPGVASEKTVSAFHLSFGKCDWNPYGSGRSPVRLSMEKWVERVGLEFIVNAVITPDDRVYAVVAGDYVKAHRAGIRKGREIYGVALPARADVVIVTSFRADEDFWLASKALFAGELVVKDGGDLILLTPCPKDIGPHPRYAEYIGSDNCDSLLEDAFADKVPEPIAVSAGVAIAKMRRRFDITIISDGLSDETVRTMKCRPENSVTAAIDRALKTRGDDATVAILPDGINTLPRIGD